MNTQLPEAFTQYTHNLMGDELYAQLLHGLTEEEAPVSIRLNPFKCPKQGDINPTISTTAQPIPWCPSTGRYLSSRPNFTFDPLLHAGLYYVQEASSMLVDLAIRQCIDHPITMLDLCAAPGGKSTAIRAALPAGSLLFSNEPMRTRSQILAENLQKFGHPDVIVTNNYPRDYKKAQLTFDAILADVPCSGEGMFRKDEGAIAEWSQQNVENCRQLQREIIADIWPCLKPGGILIYSTCTFNAHEDEENAEWIATEMGAEFLKLDTDASWGITGNLLHSDIPTYRFLPGKTRGEGLFMAVLRKEGHTADTTYATAKAGKKANKNKSSKSKAPQISLPQGWLSEQEQWQSCIVGDTLYAIPDRWKSTYDAATRHLNVIHAGIKTGTIKGKDLIPDQSLALSTSLNKEGFANVDLSYEDAIRFLRKEAVPLPTDTPRGYTLVSYRGIPLGWEKNIGNRANNLYPQEWKIKSTHIPEGDNNLLSW